MGKTEVLNELKKGDLRETIPYKLTKVCLTILIGLILVYAVLFFIEVSNELEVVSDLEGELGTISILSTDPDSGVEFPDDCAESTLKGTWDSIFKESSNGIDIIAKESDGGTCMYFLYNMNGNMVHIIRGRILEETNSSRHQAIYAFYGDFTDVARAFVVFLNLVEDYENTEVNTFFSGLVGGSEVYVQGSRSIASSSDANIEFLNTFETSYGVWEEDTEFFYFEGDEDGRIFKEKVLDYYFDELEILKPIDLTQIGNIPNITLEDSKVHFNVTDLDKYFQNLGDRDSNLGFSYPASVFLGEFSISINQDHELDFDTTPSLGGDFIANITLSYPGLGEVTSNNFNVTIKGCQDSDGGKKNETKGTAQNLSDSKTDNCTSLSNVEEYYCEGGKVKKISVRCSGSRYCADGACVINGSFNYPPRFKSEECDDLIWRKNKVQLLHINECFEDEDRDALTYRYEEKNKSGNNPLNLTMSENLTFSRDVENLTITPDTDWIGDGYFYVFADDGINETRGRINFEVTNLGPPPGNGNESDVFEIISPQPNKSVVTAYAGNDQIFSVGNLDYDSISWFLDGGLIKGGSRFYKIEDLKVGNYSIKVEIRKDTMMDSRTWTLAVEPKIAKEEGGVGFGEIVFYLIIGFIVLIIFLVIWMFILEKNKQRKRKIYGFGVEVKPPRPGMRPFR